MRRILILGNVFALIVTVLIATLTAPRTSMADTAPARKSFPVEPGTVSASIKATGHLQPFHSASLNFEVDGKVSEVYVVLGQSVITGTPLAKLDTTDLDLSVQQAQIALDKANATMAKTKAAAATDDVNSARAGLVSAQAAYNALIVGPNKDQVDAAAADLRTAEVNVQTAQAAYDKVSWRAGSGASTEAATLQTATIAYQKALANYNVSMQAPTDDKLKSAKATVASSQASLNTLLRGATPEDIALNQIDIDSARLSMRTAQVNLQRATLVAPFAGVITGVGVDIGIRPGTGGNNATNTATGGAAFTLADLSVLHVDVPVDEIDLPAVKIGQPAMITLDAMPDTPLTGRVTAIAPSPATATDTAITYDVTVTLDNQGDHVVNGMTAKAEVETQRREGVPVISALLVQTDKTGATFVETMGPDGQPVHRPVTLGLRSGENIEVVKGLALGDEVLEPPLTQAAATSSGSQPRGLFMGGPMGGGGRPPQGGGGGPRPGGGG